MGNPMSNTSSKSASLAVRPPVMSRGRGDQYFCFHCGVRGHVARVCRLKHKEVTCYHCYNVGHKKRYCPFFNAIHSSINAVPCTRSQVKRSPLLPTPSYIFFFFFGPRRALHKNPSIPCHVDFLHLMVKTGNTPQPPQPGAILPSKFSYVQLTQEAVEILYAYELFA